MNKEKIDFEIAKLIALDMSKQISDEEKEILNNWLNSSETNKQIYSRIVSKNNYAKRNAAYKEIDVEAGWKKVAEQVSQVPNRRILPVLLRYAAAIFIPLTIVAATYWYIADITEKSVAPIAQIVPGTKQAILVMADGSSVNLTNDSIKSMVENDGTVINKSGNKLIYNEQANSKAQKQMFNTIIVPRGGEYSLVLADGSRVHLNSMSKLVFPVNFSGNTRELKLEGEAYFEVTKDKTKPFIVSIRGMQVRVLGTSFNIKAYNNEPMVYTTLVEGKVQLNLESDKSTLGILNPDQQAVYSTNSHTVEIQQVDARNIAQWTSGKYFFKNERLEEIMKTLSRWYDFNYRFDDESLKNIRFEGGLNKYDSIEPILDIINKTGKIKVSVNGKDVTFSKK